MPELSSLFPRPIVQAPMAGGTSRPELAAAVSNAGALGFLAAGYKSADAMRGEIERLRPLLDGDRPFGVNLFLPQPAAVDRAAVAAYGERLAPEAEALSVPLGDPFGSTDDDYDAKLAALLADPVPVVSFTFGCPAAEDVAALRGVGTVTVATVTTPAEALAAQEAGADALCVQGVEAGGHQGTHRDEPSRDGSGLALLPLLTLVRESVDLPLVAAGGLMRGAQIAAVLAAGASAAQLGTAFVVCPESGAPAPHKAALTDPAFTDTVLTRAFSGRPARGLANRFIREHGPLAPAAYPQVNYLTAPLRKAAAAAKDPQLMALWAGQGHRLARELPAADLVAALTAELDAAVAGGHGAADAGEEAGPRR
jgi:nitronate monooxygenase